MNGRERILLVATAVMVVVGVFFKFFYEDFTATLADAGAGSLVTERDQFAQYRKILNNAQAIRSEYNNVTINVPERDGGLRPGDTFMNELERLLKTEFNQPAPRLERYTMEAIDQVEDYYFVNVQVQLSGPTAVLMRLLVQMEQRGLLIKEFTIKQDSSRWRRGEINSGQLTVEVARLVRHDEASRNQLSRLRGGR